MVCHQLGWNDEAGVDAGTTRPARPIEENNQNKVIDYARYVSHRMFNVAKLCNDRALNRFSTFSYKFHPSIANKRIYSKKTCLLKIEFYDSEKGSKHKDRVRVGMKELNLSEYVGRGPVVECHRLDFTRVTDQIYLTVRIHVTTKQEYEQAQSGQAAHFVEDSFHTDPESDLNGNDSDDLKTTTTSLQRIEPKQKRPMSSSSNLRMPGSR